MPELKRNFLKGKMNKDLDERLVPNGEYRDALNIEISSSEDSDVGSAQITLGNKSVSDLDFSPNAVTVGSYVDEQEEYIYNFVCKASDLDSEEGEPLTGIISDSIVRYKKNQSAESVTSDVVFTDAYEVRLIPTGANAVIGAGPGQNPVITSDNKIYGIPLNQIDTYGTDVDGNASLLASIWQPDGIKPGMRVQAIDTDGKDLWANNDVRVVDTLVSGSAGYIKITPVVGYATGYLEFYGASMIADDVVLRFTSDRILKLEDGTIEVETNNKKADKQDAYTTAQYTPKSNIVTGINIIDGMLYWTDGISEPKKINIEKFIKGSAWSTNVSGSSDTSRSLKNTTKIKASFEKRIDSFVKEHHTTVIRHAPTMPPKVVKYYSRPGNTSSKIQRRWSDNTGSTLAFPYEVGYELVLGALADDINWKAGDEIELTSQGDTTDTVKQIKVRLTSNSIHGAPWFNAEITYIQEGYPAAGVGGQAWIGRLVEKDPIYADSFLSFAYRYKYADGETSVISPYSKPVFAPGKYSYDPNTGFNEGMVNSVISLQLKEFIPKGIPEDVTEVELLYRDTNSANQVVSLAKIKPDSSAWNYIGSGFGEYTTWGNKGFFEVDATTFGATLPSDQVDRNEDHVPTSALAQEITESRLMYGNYTLGYNLWSERKSNVKLNLLSYLSQVPDSVQYNQINSTNTFEASLEEPISNAFNSSQSDRIYYVDYSQPNILPTSVESFDYGSNFNNEEGTTNYLKYTVPTTGKYSFEAEIKWLGLNELSPPGGVSEHWWYFVPAKLRLRKGDGVEVTVANSGAGAVINAEKYPGIDDAPVGAEQYGGGGVGTSPDWSHVTVSGQFNNISLTAGTVVYLEVVVDPPTQANLPLFKYQASGNIYGPVQADSWKYPTSHKASIASGTFKCTSAPELSEAIVISNGQESIKSQRSYSLGVVYRDYYNRQSTVLLDTKANFESLKSDSTNVDKITAIIRSQPPSFAEYYKFFIKENTSQYYNLVLAGAYDNNDDPDGEQFAWLSFNSSDVDKVKKEDYLILKKRHNSSEPVTAESARWRVLDVSDAAPSTAGNDETPLIISNSESVGKFFVKVAYDADFISYIGSNFSLLGPSESGAVFETEPKTIELSDESSLYWEASQAYPIKLSEENASTYIKSGTKVELYKASGVTSTQRQALENKFTSSDVIVTAVKGAKTFAKSLLQTRNSVSSSLNKHAYCLVATNTQLTNIEIPSGFATIDLKFTDLSDGSFVVARLGKSTYNSSFLFLVPYTCPVGSYPTMQLPITLPWYNCINFSNGVESDAIKDDYNSDTIFEYLPAGKSSGLKASAFYEDYKKEYNTNEIIFSQVFNEKTNYNRFNEFLFSKGVVKQLSKEYGSIQRLVTRDNDLLAFCENKVLRILASKDQLFNADGTSNLTSSKDVLGTAIPFSGDYGISKNPESLALDEYRIYFTDKARGSVLRLSKDGITVISDYGLSDWFFDNLKDAQGLVGSFDGKKNQYNLTVHSVTNPNSKKEVYTVSFSENVKGWSSFKSFIKESGVTLNNYYYTFKNGKPWIHHSESVDRNNFYGVAFDSSITSIFNEVPGAVKTFSTISYEGTQSKVDANDNALDNNYYNISDKAGWYVEEVATDMQEGEVSEFVEKEGKWFNNITGVATNFSNGGNDVAPTGNLDTREFSVQGIGLLANDCSVVSGTIDGYDFDLTLNIIGNDTWSTDPIVLQNITQTQEGSQYWTTFTITPTSGSYITSLQFDNFVLPGSPYIDTINFSPIGGLAGLESNAVQGVIRWRNRQVPQDTTISLDLSSIVGITSPIDYKVTLDVFHNKTSVSAINYFTGIDYSTNGDEWNSSTGTLTLNGGDEVVNIDLWPIDQENGNLFTLNYTIDAASTVTSTNLILPFKSETINSSDIELNVATGSHSVSIPVTNNGTTNRIFFKNTSTDPNQVAIITNISLERFGDFTEVVSFEDVAPQLLLSDDQLPNDDEKSRYYIYGLLESDVDYNLFKIRVQAQGSAYYTTPPKVLFMNDGIDDHSISNEQLYYNPSGFTNGYSAVVEYNSNSGLSGYDVFAQVGLQSEVEYFFSSFNLENLIIDDSAVTTTANYSGAPGGSPTFSVISGGSWLTVEESSNISTYNNQYADSEDVSYEGQGFVSISAAAQAVGAPQRTGVIGITSPYNESGTPDDTINVVQKAEGATEYIDIFNPGDTSSPYVITTGKLPGFAVTNDPLLGDVIFKEMYVATQSEDFDVNDVTVTVNTGDADWLVVTGVEQSSSIGNYVVHYYVKSTDSSVFTRQATVKASHPDNASVYDEQIIQQDMFDPSANAISVQDGQGNSSITSFSEGEDVTVEITSSQSGSPLPIVELSQPVAYWGPSFNELNNAIQTFEYDFELGNVEVVTGESYTHKVLASQPQYPNDSLTAMQGAITPGSIIVVQIYLKVYHPLDYAFSSPKLYSLNQVINAEEPITS